MATQEHTLKEALAQGRAMITLARYKARQMVQQQYRSAGRKIHTVKLSELHADADRYLAEHRAEMMAWAQNAVTKINSAAQRKRR